MTKTEMTQAEFMEIIAQNPQTKAQIIARIEAEMTRVFEEANEQNEKLMEADGCSQDDIDFVKDWNNALLWPTIKQAIEVLGLNLKVIQGGKQ